MNRSSITKRAKSLPRYLSGWAVPLAISGIIALLWGVSAIRRFAGNVDPDTELTVPLLLRELILPHTVLVLGILLLSYSIILLAILARHSWQTHRRNLYCKTHLPLDDKTDKPPPDDDAASPEDTHSGNPEEDDELSQNDAEIFFKELLSEELNRKTNPQQEPPPKR